MTSFAVVAIGTGAIVRIGRTAVLNLADMTDEAHDIIAPIPEGVSDGTHYWDGEEFVLRLDLSDLSGTDLLALRINRDRRLAACDWTQMPDAPLSETARAAWQGYRQALRDMPETTADPASPVWPITPA